MVFGSLKSIFTMDVKEHYDKHLANFYAWMTGDFDKQTASFRSFLQDHFIIPTSSGLAVDLGAGHGIQTVALVQQGFKVTAIDFNEKLLQELKDTTKDLPVITVLDDITAIKNHIQTNPELVICCGDTIAHLNSDTTIEQLLRDIAHVLDKNGKLILSFRDYSVERKGDQRFIPVKSDTDRILTCILDYEETHVRVTDLLYTHTQEGWIPTVSSYQKVRVTAAMMRHLLEQTGFVIQIDTVIQHMIYMIASKQ